MEAKKNCLEFNAVLCKSKKPSGHRWSQLYLDTPTIDELKAVDHDFLSPDQLSGKTVIPNQFISHNVEPLRIWTDFKRVNFSHFKQRSTDCTTSQRLRSRIYLWHWFRVPEVVRGSLTLRVKILSALFHLIHLTTEIIIYCSIPSLFQIWTVNWEMHQAI